MGKAQHNISNWRQYNRALINRGSLTFWVDEQAIEQWHCHQHHGRRGRGFQYSDSAIETALMLKAFFGCRYEHRRVYQLHFSADGGAADLAGIQQHLQTRQNRGRKVPLAEQRRSYASGH